MGRYNTRAWVRQALAAAKGDTLAAVEQGRFVRVAVGADGTAYQADSTQTAGVKWAPPSRLITTAVIDAGPLNTITETDLALLALPTTLAVGDLVRFTAYGDQLNNAGTVNYTYKLYVGTTAVITTNAIAPAQTSNRRRWFFEGEMEVILPASSQRVGSRLSVGATAATVTMPVANSGVYLGTGYGTAAEDLTSAKNLRLTATLDTANSLADCICHFATVEVLKK